MTSFDDISLVAKAAVLHDKKAFNALVVKYQEPIRRFFLNHTLGDMQLSDDLAQDTFLKAYTHLTQFRGVASFSTWLYRIAYNVFYDYVRSRKLTEDLAVSGREGQADGRRDVIAGIDIYDALRRLKAEERTCITLQLMEGKSIDKIADITGMAQGTVKSHLSRGKEKLTIYLRKNGYDGR